MGGGHLRLPCRSCAQRGLLLHRPAAWALLLPSVWLLANLLLPPGETTGAHVALFWLDVLLAVVGVPVMAAVLVRLLLPGANRMTGQQAGAAVAVVLVVMAVSYLLGAVHPRLLTCEDFTTSGNSAPAGCTPASDRTAG